MFGHQDDKDDKSSQKNTDSIPDSSIHGVLNDTSDQEPLASQPDKPDTAIEPVASADSTSPNDLASGAAPAASNDQSWQHPGAPLGGDPSQISDVISPAGGFPRSMSSQLPAPGSVSSTITTPGFTTDITDDASANTSHVLIDIKQHALEELEPLIDKLDQVPEDKFRTIMMMIQASDDRELIPKAYEVAHTIEDEKIRAQALLDIVNEINYFTQQPEPGIQPED